MSLRQFLSEFRWELWGLVMGFLAICLVILMLVGWL